MTPSRYTVLICTHNRCRILPEALQTLARVRPPAGTSVDLIVVDNASPDRTAEAVRAFASSAPFPVRYIHEPRLGKSYALNTGLAAAAGDVVAFTDDDAFPDAHWLEALHHSFVERDADWAFGSVRPRWEVRQPSFFGPETWGLFAILNYGAEPFVAASPTQGFIGVNTACRRSVLDRIGGFREDLGPSGTRGAVGEDDELYLRSLRAGLRIVYTPDATVEHFIPEPRCQEGYHRSKTWRDSEAYYLQLLRNPPAAPKFLGLPRYFYRKPIDHCACWVRDGLRGKRSGAFHHQLQTIRFLSLIWRGFRRLLTASPRLAVVRDAAPVP